MERNTPVRKTHTNTSDLLVWPENSSQNSSLSAENSSASRSHQPSDRIGKVIFGGQVTEEEAESLMKRKPCSGYKMKEMTGSGIFVGDGENGASEAGSAKRVYQAICWLFLIIMFCISAAVTGISQISFSADGSVSPKKPVSIPEVAKQRELSGNLETEADKMKKQLSDAKCKELSGNDIFGPAPRLWLDQFLQLVPESKDMGEPAPRNVRTSVKVSNRGHSVKTAKKIHNQKFQELTGNDIFKGDLSETEEMSGSNIFADGKATSRDFLGGVRKPPGGESSIALV
ncbi:hypothetical protein MKW92_012762 [Papaver armeniacum]|nr:hypothetical protein MKW92_012762 [Papaver armeniacum]